MSDFLIRSTKYYATVEVTLGTKVFKKEDVVFVKGVSENGVAVYIGETAAGPTINIPITLFVHAFTDSK